MIENYVNKADFESYEDFKQNYRLKVPDNFNFSYDIVDKIAFESPERTALVWCNEDGDSASFTFADLKDKSNRVAAFMQSLGIKKGDRVMLMLKRHYEYWFCYLAMHKIGAVCIPATHMLTSHDLEYRNNSANISMIIAVNEERIIQSVEDAKNASPTLKHLVLADGSRDGWLSLKDGMEDNSLTLKKPTGDAYTNNDDISLLYFTSGTTGMPKMVLHNFVYPLAHLITTKYWQNVVDGGLHLTVADTGWAKAAWGKMYAQWICGSAIFVYDYERFDAAEMLNIISKYKVTTFCAPTTVYRLFLTQDLNDYDLSSLKHCTVAGEPLSPEIYNRFLKLTGHKIMEGFGQTETIVQLANFHWMDPKPGSMGKPSPLYDIELIDDNGNACDVGDEGQIIIRIDKQKPIGLFLGYHNDKALTDSVMHDGIYYTGDTAWKDEDGYYWFIGRADDIIKTSGYRVGPFEVENALLKHSAVLECAITGIPDPMRGHIVKATIVLDKGYTGGDGLVKELQDHVKTVTAPYKYPRIIEFVDQLPRTTSGKISRARIRNPQKENGD